MNSDSESGSASIADCKCIAGYALVGGNCEPCPRGTWSDTVGATTLEICKECGPGFDTAEKATKSPDDCLCKQGMYKAPGNESVCHTCPSGTYK